jgi:hypothetical protein
MGGIFEALVLTARFAAFLVLVPIKRRQPIRRYAAIDCTTARSPKEVKTGIRVAVYSG